MYSIDEIIEKASEIIDINDFKSQVNTRQYEIKVTSIAKSIVINKEIYNELSQAVDKYYEDNRALSFTLFFILFTVCRRQNYGDYLELAVSYEEKFKEYEIMMHIELMGTLAKSCQPYIIYKAIKDASGLVCFKNDNCDFSEHSGVLNAYTELICKYFEHHLDERDGYENKELLKKALDCIKKAIEIEMKKNGSRDAVYEKLYLNYGRVLILLGEYTAGEEQIIKAINLLSESADRNTKIVEYNQYLLKASITHSYDLNEEKVKDLDKLKVSNYKSLALMTTLLGFLLGSINIFGSVETPFTLAMLMLGYAGLLFMLLGVILLGLTLTFKEKKKRFLVYDIVVVVIGIIIFTVTMLIIL